MASVMHSYGLVLSVFNPAYRKALSESDYVFTDGIGITTLVSILIGKSNRITGSDLFNEVMNYQNEVRGSVYFVGADDVCLEIIKDRVRREWPKIDRVGTYSPSFSKNLPRSEQNLIVEAITYFQPNVLWVGMTAPKQEIFISDTRTKLDIQFTAGIGAVFDFFPKKRRELLFG